MRSSIMCVNLFMFLRGGPTTLARIHNYFDDCVELIEDSQICHGILSVMLAPSFSVAQFRFEDRSVCFHELHGMSINTCE